MSPPLISGHKAAFFMPCAKLLKSHTPSPSLFQLQYSYIYSPLIKENSMANVTRFDPFQISGFDPLEDVFKGFFRPVRIEGTPEVQIKVDVKESDKGYSVHAEIPGVKKEDIHVTIDGNQVSISAEVKQEKEVKEGEKVLRSERYYGKVARSFALGNEIDEAQSQAKYTDGVLELQLPKKAANTSKKLTIN
jgi:HSP20 family protein